MSIQRQRLCTKRAPKKSREFLSFMFTKRRDCRFDTPAKYIVPTYSARKSTSVLGKIWMGRVIKRVDGNGGDLSDGILFAPTQNCAECEYSSLCAPLFKQGVLLPSCYRRRRRGRLLQMTHAGWGVKIPRKTSNDMSVGCAISARRQITKEAVA